jgi:hypothetical protein
MIHQILMVEFQDFTAENFEKPAAENLVHTVSRARSKSSAQIRHRPSLCHLPSRLQEWGPITAKCR